MRATKVPAVRFWLFWATAQPTKNGPLNWGPTDQIVGNLAARGIESVPFVFGSPKWMYKNPRNPPTRQSDRPLWKGFLSKAVERYGPGGSYWATAYHTQHPGAKALPIRAWQIWNEPNLKFFWPPKPSPSGYAQLVEDAHDAIKGQDPGAKIVLGGFAGFGDVYAWKFLDGLYGVNGIKKDFDAVALHPYSPNLRQLKQELMRVRRVMSKHGDRKAPLWITELGWGSSHKGGELNVGVAGQKRMLTKSFKLLTKLRHKRHLQRVFWFDWRDPAPPTQAHPAVCKVCPYAGLLKHNHKPKPAWHAYKRFTR
jgi:Glycosyl hydrolase catalytic core